MSDTCFVYEVSFDSGYMVYVRAPTRKEALKIGHAIVPYDARCQWRYMTKTRARRVCADDIPRDAVIHRGKGDRHA